jgi:hypothetical protein
MLIRTGFKTTCDPAGDAECRIEGEMNIAAVDDVIELLEMLVRRLRTKIDEAREADGARELETRESSTTPEQL